MPKEECETTPIAKSTFRKERFYVSISTRLTDQSNDI